MLTSAGIDKEHEYLVRVGFDSLPSNISEALKSLQNMDIDPEHLDKDAADLAEIARQADGIEHEVAEMLEEDKSVYNAQVSTANRRELAGASKYGSGK